MSTDQVDEILLEDQSSLTAKNLTGENSRSTPRSGGTLIAVNCKHKIIDLRHEGSGNIILKGRETMEIKAKVYGSGSLLGKSCLSTGHPFGMEELVKSCWHQQPG